MADVEPDGGEVVPCPKCKAPVALPPSTDASWIETGIIERRIKGVFQCPSCRHRFEMQWFPDGRMSFCPADGLGRILASIGFRPYDF